jgi:hypothetical protein
VSGCAAGYADHVDADVALAFADHALGAAERTEVERRIDTCSGCRAAVAEAARGSSQATKVERPAGARPARNISVELRPGDSVGRYIVERALGAGGMGVVSLARDPELRRAVVIKLVRPDVHDVEFEARLRREAQAMAQLSHPNVVQIFDIGRHGDRVFLAMEFVPGQTLDAWLIERERTTQEVIGIFLQAGAGLEAAHRAGLLHRDFKPANVLVDRNGVAKVTDFGLARSLATTARQTAAMSAPPLTGVHAVFTHQDSVVGTPAYMAPEQAAGEPLDARTDQYALALSLLDALVAQPPTRRTVAPMAEPAVLEEALARARVPERARRAVVRALRIDPAERFPDLASFLRELAPPRESRRWWPLAAIAVVAAGGVAAWLATRGAPTVCRPEAPRAWQDGPRAAVQAKLAAKPRAFAAWHAEHVLAQLDAAATEIGALEVQRCEGNTVDAACLDQRRAALAQVAERPLDNPRAELRAVTRCDDEDEERLGRIAALRSGLTGADAAHARSIADRARELDDDLLRADALDHAGRHALALGYFKEAADDFVASASAAERAGDDSLRARALLGRLEVARMRAELAPAHDLVRQLDGMLERHNNPPHDVFVVALAAATAYTELGDGGAAFAQLERAQAAAKSPDEALRARLALARAQHVLRWDREATDRALADALATTGASAGVRADALAFAIDLAIERTDAATAAARLAELLAIRSDDLRAARVRALAGDPDAALAALARIPAGDATTRARVDIATAEIQLRAGRGAETSRILSELIRRTREPTSIDYDYERIGLSAFERTHAWFLRCDAAYAQQSKRDCWDPPWLEKMHASAPLRARQQLNQYRAEKREGLTFARLSLAKAIEILAGAKIEPITLAELRLELVRLDPTRYDRKEHAKAAREAFAAAGRAAEVAELDAVLAAP